MTRRYLVKKSKAVRQDSHSNDVHGPDLQPPSLAAVESAEENLIDFDDDSIGPTLPEEGGLPSSLLIPRSSKDMDANSEISILVMGSTGAGKSSFIAKVTGAPVVIGDTIEPCTVRCEGFEFIYDAATKITLIDTPGFNDFTRSDMDILDSIVKYVQTKAHGRIAGIIYLHRITDKRITGSSRMNLRMLKALCGEHFFQNVILTTTMWGTVTAKVIPDLETREAELNGTPAFWEDMIEKGAQYARYDNSESRGRAVIDMCLARRSSPTLNILLEMQQGRRLEDTSAGLILTEELRKREERKREEIRQEQEGEREALQRQKEEMEERLRTVEGKSDKKRLSRRHYRRKEERWLDDGRQGRQGRRDGFGSDEVVAREEESRRSGMDPLKNVLGCLLGGVRWQAGYKAQRT